MGALLLGVDGGNTKTHALVTTADGTVLGTGVAGAMIAAGTRAGPQGLGPALAAVLALSIGAAVLGLIASGRVGTFTAREDRGSAAVD